MKKVETTIQLSREEDREIIHLKRILGLPSKKAVIREGMRSLLGQVEEENRRRKLQTASHLVRNQSQEANRAWAPHSSALHKG